jgi:hypothetical protein
MFIMTRRNSRCLSSTDFVSDRCQRAGLRLRTQRDLRELNWTCPGSALPRHCPDRQIKQSHRLWRSIHD